MNERKKLNYQISTDYFNYKHATDGAKLRIDDQLSLAKMENESLKEAMNKIIESEKGNEVYNENLYAHKTDQFADRFRKNT